MVSKEENTGVEGLISNQHPSGQGEKLIVSKYNVTKRTAIWWEGNSFRNSQGKLDEISELPRRYLYETKKLDNIIQIYLNA